MNKQFSFITSQVFSLTGSKDFSQIGGHLLSGWFTPILEAMYHFVQATKDLNFAVDLHDNITTSLTCTKSSHFD